MSNRIRTSPVITLDSSERVTTLSSDSDFTLSKKPSPIPQNLAVTPWGGRVMIKDLFTDIWDVPERQNDIIAVEFDRQSLLLTLAQNGCEGIRFTLCQFEGRKSLVAFGIGSDGKLIGEDMFRIGFNDRTAPPVVGMEQGHGLTLGDFKDVIKTDSKDFAKISERFLALNSNQLL